MKIIIFISLIMYFLIPTQSVAQNKCRITGTVTNLSTGKQINYVNVFLSGTTFGSTTNKDGQYKIVNIPPGSYEIFATFMGYKSAYTNVQIFGAGEKIINFKLEPKVLEGETVSISAEPPKEWKKDLEIFKKIFFGGGEYSEQYSLKNPEVLDFKHNKSNGDFEASNQAEAVYLNQALGYRVSFILLKFYNNLRGGKKYIYSALTRFEELEPKNEIEHNKWIINRLLAYNGSIQHFIKALWQGQLKKEGFEIKRLKNYREFYVYPDTLLVPTITPDLYILKPCRDLIKITYKNEKNIKGYQSWSKFVDNFGDDPRIKYRLLERFSKQITKIEIPDSLSCIISEDLVIILQPPTIQGYWAKDKAPKWLPANYKPPILKD